MLVSLHPQVSWSTGTGLCPQPGTSPRQTSTTAGLLIARPAPPLTSGRSWPSPSQVSIPVLPAGLGQAAALLLFLLAEGRLCLVKHQHLLSPKSSKSTLMCAFLSSPPSLCACVCPARSARVCELPIHRYVNYLFFPGQSNLHPSFALPIACYSLASVPL